MNIIEKQAELGRSILEINTSTFKELASLQRQNIEKYFETNRAFGEKLPEVRDISSFVSLQREYGETLWNNAREAVETQSGIVRGAFEETRSALQKAFTGEAADDTTEKAGTQAKKAPATKKAAARNTSAAA